MKSHFASEERFQCYGETILRFADDLGKASVSPTPFPSESCPIYIKIKIATQLNYQVTILLLLRGQEIVHRSYSLAL
jgi:hypothetical protein